MKRKNILILGAAGRDFHNFNVYFRNNPGYDVKAFTATQIPDIAGRKYPAKLSGKFYKKGIPIYPEEKMEELIRKLKIDEVFFSYSDVSHIYVMHLASRSQSAGASFVLLGPDATMIKSKKPVIAVCAVRTGAGKSPTSQAITKYFSKKYKIVVVRHPMPYGDLEKQEVQRFSSYKDLDKHNCTIEEREEYESHIANGIVVYAGVDYEKILRQAEKEADIILFDGGNNDFPFYKPDLHITVADPLRAGHEINYYPGETNFRMADVILINKINSATKEQIATVEENSKIFNKKAKIIRTKMLLDVSGDIDIKGRRAIIVEDGPTLTHGEMNYGAGFVASKNGGAKIIDAKPFAKGTIADVYKKYSRLKTILPAMGYSKRQIKDLENTINSARCDIVINGSPIDISKLIKSNKPIVRVKYRIEENKIKSVLASFERKFL